MDQGLGGEPCQHRSMFRRLRSPPVKAGTLPFFIGSQSRQLPFLCALCKVWDPRAVRNMLLRMMRYCAAIMNDIDRGPDPCSTGGRQRLLTRDGPYENTVRPINATRQRNMLSLQQKESSRKASRIILATVDQTLEV